MGLIRDGIPVEFENAQGKKEQERVRVIDFTPENANDFLAVSQLWIKGERCYRRPDILLCINGIPLVFIEFAVEEFFAWEKKSIRRECIRKAEQADVKAAKLALIREFRKSGVFVLERGSLEDYYPEITGSDKPSKAQAFIKRYHTPEQILTLSPQQTCPYSMKVATEFEFICSTLFAGGET
jgi:hypothetical protein